MLRVEVTNGLGPQPLQRRLQVRDVGRAQVHQRVGLAGDRVRADHLGVSPGGRRDLRRRGAPGAEQLDERLGGPADGGRVDDGGESPDHPGGSQPVDPSLDRRGGERHPCPMSAYEARASATSNAMIRWSIGVYLQRFASRKQWLSAVTHVLRVPTLGDREPAAAPPRKRTYLMCSPEHFVVEYAINPWMDVTTPVDTELAVKQWEALRETLVGLGHEVHLLDPGAGLPDMVFAANGAFSVDGVVYGARFSTRSAPPRPPPTRRSTSRGRWRFIGAERDQRGRGRLRVPARRARRRSSSPVTASAPSSPAHAEAQEALGRPVISLRLVDPRFYHLDVALAVARRPQRRLLPGRLLDGVASGCCAQLFPDAVIADEEDALAFGLNLVSDGRNVVLNSEATALAGKLGAAGYEPVPVDLAELKKGGGSVKCCIAELRP